MRDALSTAATAVALERNSWQQPVDGGAISQRGKQAAAEEKVRQLMTVIRERGCTEEFVPNPTLLLDGQVRPAPARSPHPRLLMHCSALIY